MPTPRSIAVPRSRPVVAVGLGVLAGTLVALVALAFLWPVATSTAHDVPVGVVGGPLPQANRLPIEATAYATRADAVRAIRAREVDGALVLGAAGPEALVAGAEGAPAAALLEGIAEKAAAASGARLTTTDVVPLSADDPAGAGIGALGFPLVLGGILGGVLVSLLIAGVTRRLLGLLVYAAVGGVLGAVVAGPMLGILDARLGSEALAIGAGMLGTASTVVGLNALLGVRGIAVGAVIAMLIGNPLSAATLPHQFIAGPWGSLGQDLVPGATASLIRAIDYFPDASTVHEWVVLLAWILAGVVLSALGHYRSTTPVHLPEGELEHAGGAHLA